MKVFISGEGKTELGGWADAAPYRPHPVRIGLIEALLRKLQPTGWDVGGAVSWSRSSQFGPGKKLSAETRTVSGLLLDAQEAGCDALVFVRDLDGEASRDREIEEGLRLVVERSLETHVAGGVAIDESESWLLSMRGYRSAESISDAKAAFAAAYPADNHLDGKVAIITAADLDTIPSDAHSLLVWLARARAILGVPPAS